MPKKPVKKSSKKSSVSRKHLMFSDIKFASQKKNLDNMKLLVSYPDFQSDIKEARKFLGIPSDGFRGNDEDHKKWFAEVLPKSEAIMDSPEFNQQLRAIWEKKKRGEITRRMEQKQLALLYHKVPCNYLREQPQFLAAKYNVPEHFAPYIEGHMVVGGDRVSAPSLNFAGGGYPPGVRPWEVRHFPINIYAQLTDAELKDLARYIKALPWGRRLPKFQAIKGGIDSKLTIEKYFDSERIVDELRGIDRPITSGEVAQKAWGNKNLRGKAFDINRGIKALKKRRFGNQMG